MIGGTFGALASLRHIVIRRPIGVGVLVAASSLSCLAHESTSCGTNIISATVVATFCGHPQGSDQRLDLMILWRGAPGWFQRHDVGTSGSGGTRRFGRTTNGYVAQHSTYGNVTIRFEADFDANHT